VRTAVRGHVYPHGAYRRRIRVVNASPTRVEAGLEDDFHCFQVTVDHDGRQITDVRARALRWPWTTCPDAGAALRALVGMPLASSCLAVGDYTNPRLQCTHQFDLAGLAVAHARRSARMRQYDVTIPYGVRAGHTTDVHLVRDDGFELVWTLEDRLCIAPPPYSEARWRGGFLRWAERTFPPDHAEAVIVLRRACDIGAGRGFDLESIPSADGLLGAQRGICYTFQPEIAAVSFRNYGAIRDFDARPADLLADGPF
jgi:hypothetical protein